MRLPKLGRIARIGLVAAAGLALARLTGISLFSVDVGVYDCKTDNEIPSDKRSTIGQVGLRFVHSILDHLEKLISIVGIPEQPHLSVAKCAVHGQRIFHRCCEKRCRIC